MRSHDLRRPLVAAGNSRGARRKQRLSRSARRVSDVGCHPWAVFGGEGLARKPSLIARSAGKMICPSNFGLQSHPPLPAGPAPSALCTSTDEPVRLLRHWTLHVPALPRGTRASAVQEPQGFGPLTALQSREHFAECHRRHFNRDRPSEFSQSQPSEFLLERPLCGHADCPRVTAARRLVVRS